MCWHKDRWATAIWPPSAGKSLFHICLPWDVWHLERLRISHFVLHQSSDVETKSTVNLLWLGIEYVIVKRSLFHDTSSCVHWNPYSKRNSKYIWVKPFAHYIGFLRYEWVFHRKASLSSLTMGLSMEETFLISCRLCWRVCSIEASVVICELLILQCNKRLIIIDRIANESAK